jgi:RNA polymerase sigma-70 factor (ECF subfamily)
VQIKAIVQECLDGKEGAWEMLVNTYSKKIFNMAFQFSGSFQEAEDLTQDIFVKLYGSLSKYDLEKDFTAWLLTLTKNYLIDHYRKTKWERRTRDDFDEIYHASGLKERPENELVKEENRRMIWDSFNFLSNEIRMAIILREIQGKKYEEIAEIMSLPLGTVKSRVSRGRIQLAQILKERKKGETEWNAKK